jgi:TonB family protein
MFRVCLLVIWSVSSLSFAVPAQEPKTSLRVAVLDFAESGLGRIASERLAANLKQTGISILDRDLSRAAAAGVGYSGSLNLMREQARDLGAALGCEYFILGDSQTVRRSPSNGPIYFESYASLFLVSARTGNLIMWERPSFKGPGAPDADKLLLTELSSAETRQRFLASMRRAHEDEQHQREFVSGSTNPVIEEAPADDKTAEAAGLRLPRAFRRLRPAYPDAAARADAEATVDILADIDTAGEVTHVEIARWAGFGLDDATVETVRQLHFFPAMRNGKAIPIRVLLRYNFRKPVKE